MMQSRDLGMLGGPTMTILLRRAMATAVATMVLVGCARSGAGNNLLVNGSFEEGTDPGAFLPVAPGALAITGWTTTRGQIDYIGSYWRAADGKRSVDLHGSPGFGGVSQSFKTEKGRRYRLAFSLAGNPEGSVPKKRLVARAAGQTKEFTVDATGKSKTAMGWQNETWEFAADSERTTLELYSPMTEDGACGPTIDNVSVVAL
jgi:choice-of-anchor C domain-containing protein